MEKDLIVDKLEEWYISLRDEIKAATVEKRKEKAYDLIREKYTYGEILVRYQAQKGTDDKGMTAIVTQVARDCECSKQVFWQSLRFFRLVGEDLDTWLVAQPQENVVNWTKIKKVYFGDPTPKDKELEIEKFVAKLYKKYGIETVREIGAACLRYIDTGQADSEGVEESAIATPVL